MKLIDKKDIAIISIPLPIAKFKEITFELNKDLKSDKEQINDFCKLIYELKTEINELKNEDNKKQIEINELKIEMAELKEQMKNLLNEIKIKEDKKFISNLNRWIINENIEYNRLLKFWINPNIIINAELLYRLSRDGDQTSKFHELYDNQGPTLTLFEIDDGQKGGFYTPLSWDNYSKWQNDMETFSFNLNNKEKYKKIKNDHSIYCSNDYGPWISNFGFHQSMRKIIHEGTGVNNYYRKGAEILSNDTNGVKYFNVKEVEVYKIIII